MKWELACSDFTFPLLSHDHALDLIARLGVTCVDVGLFEGRSHLHPSNEFARPTAPVELARKAADRGLQIADIFLQTDPDFTALAANHPDSIRRGKARDWFLKTIDYAKRCGSPHVSTLPGVIFDAEPSSDSRSRCCGEMAWRVERANDADIVFGIEAHVGSVAPTPQEALQLVTFVPGLTLTLDYTHFTSRGYPDADIEPLIAYASHFHVRGARLNRLQCTFKENVIDYRRVLQAMAETNYCGRIGVEYVWVNWEHCNEVDNLSETILFLDFLTKECAV